MGGGGCEEDIHSGVGGCTDSVGVDPRDYHTSFYEPIPAKEEQETGDVNGWDVIS